MQIIEDSSHNMLIIRGNYTGTGNYLQAIFNASTKQITINKSISGTESTLATFIDETAINKNCIHGSWSSSSSLTIPMGGTYSTALFVGYLQGHGTISLLFYKNNTSLSVYTTSGGTAFTSSYHTFTRSGNNLVITSSASGKSEGTFLIGAWT